MRRVEEAQRLAMEAFRWSSDYQRDLSKAVADSFLMGFVDYCMKVLQKYPNMDLDGISSIDTPSMPQVHDSPFAGDVDAFMAPTEEGNAVRD